jgi:hypothetical protein
MSLHRRDDDADTARMLSFAAIEIVCSKRTIPLYRPPRNNTEMVEHKMSPGIGLSDNQVIGNKIFRALQPRIMCVRRQGYKPSNAYFPNTTINNIQWAMTIWWQPDRELALPSSEVRTMYDEVTNHIPYSISKTQNIPTSLFQAQQHWSQSPPQCRAYFHTLHTIPEQSSEYNRNKDPTCHVQSNCAWNA